MYEIENGDVMRLKANIEIEVDAADFVAAAQHQKAIQDMAASLAKPYPMMSVKFGLARSAMRQRVSARGEKQKPAQGYEDYR